MRVNTPTCLIYIYSHKLFDEMYYYFNSVDYDIDEFRDSVFIECAGSLGENSLVHGKLTGSVNNTSADYVSSDGIDITQYYNTDRDHIIIDNGSVIAPNPGLCLYPNGAFDYYEERFRAYHTPEYVISCKATIYHWKSIDRWYWYPGFTYSLIYLTPINQRYARAGYFTPKYIPWCESYDECLSMIDLYLHDIVSRKNKSYYLPVCFFRSSYCTWDYKRLPSIYSRFRFNEPSWIGNGGARGGDNYTFHHLQQSAFWDAASSIQVLNQNFIQTIVEALSFLMKVKSGKFSLKEALPDSLSSAWLSYRYCYNTNKMDMEEAISFIKWTGMFDMTLDYTTHGYASYNDIECRCSLTVRSKFLSAAQKAWSTLYEYGIQPNFYVLWDFTPFSFIVDWFIPVGELCDIIDRQNYLCDTFNCVSAVYSLHYGDVMETPNMSLEYDLYSRWVEYRFPPVEFCYLYEDNASSNKTILFRCLDAASLILGRK